MQDLIEQLGLNFKLVFIQLIGFVVLLWLLKRFLFGRVMEMIQTRGDEIKSAYDDNERARQELQALKDEYELKIREARQEADLVVQKATQKAEQASQELLDKTRKEAALIKEKGLADIEQEKERVVSEIRNDVINISVEIASRIIEKSIDPSEAQKLNEELIQKIGGVSF